MPVSIGGTSGITIPATASNQSGAVAWVNFNGLSGASPVIRASYNIASVVRNSTGNYTVTFTSALVDANYCLTSLASTYAGNSPTISLSATPTASAFTIQTMNSGSGTVADQNLVCVAVFR